VSAPRFSWARLYWAWRTRTAPWRVPRSVYYLATPTDADVEAARRWADASNQDDAPATKPAAPPENPSHVGPPDSPDSNPERSPAISPCGCPGECKLPSVEDVQAIYTEAREAGAPGLQHDPASRPS